VDAVDLELANDGPSAVELISARLSTPGFAPIETHRRIGPRGATVLRLSPAGACEPSLLLARPSTFRVRLRTDRGDVTERSLDLLGQIPDEVESAIRHRCEYFRPDEALTFEATGVRTVGRDVVITGTASNSSSLPVSINDVLGPPGVEATLVEPAVLPAATDGTPSRRPLAIRLHVTSCAVMRDTIGLGAGPDVDTVVVSARTDIDDDHVALPVTYTDGNEHRIAPVYPMAMYGDVCPDLFLGTDVPAEAG
jgi:hypothetical protein